MTAARPLLLSLLLAGAAAAADTTFTPPAAWTGTTAGQAAGNPTADGRWRFDRVLGDIETAASWTPLVWKGDGWIAPDHVFGGQPGAGVAPNGAVGLGIRGPWSGGGDADNDKTCGLVFIAPAAGTYLLRTTAVCDRWNGEGNIFLRTMRREKAKAYAVSEIDTSPLEPKGATTLDPQKVVLAAGDELGLFAQTTTFHTAASVTITPVIAKQP